MDSPEQSMLGLTFFGQGPSQASTSQRRDTSGDGDEGAQSESASVDIQYDAASSDASASESMMIEEPAEDTTRLGTTPDSDTLRPSTAGDGSAANPSDIHASPNLSVIPQASTGSDSRQADSRSHSHTSGNWRSRIIPRINTDVDAITGGRNIGDSDIWNQYVSEATEYDKRTIDDWNSSMDVILIFAGLFSAILTAFIIEFYKFLRPDSGEITTEALIDISLVLRATAQNQTLPEPRVLPAEQFDFRTPTSILWVNALWFCSLAFSLAAAVAVMVVKQWLQFYSADLNSGNDHFDALHRQYRQNALLAWRVPTIVFILPLMMHISVGLFLAGVIIQLWQFNRVIGIIILVLVTVLVFVYGVALLLPLIYPGCPYKSSALILLQQTFHGINIAFWAVSYQTSRLFSFSDSNLKSSLVQIQQTFKPKAIGATFSPVWLYIQAWIVGWKVFFESPVHFMRGRLASARVVRHKDWEQRRIEKKEPNLDIDGLLWLIKASGKQNLVDQGLISISKLKPEPDLVDLCLLHEIPGLLIRKAYLPLPGRDHDSWRDPNPARFWSQSRRSNLDNIGYFLMSLMFIWHNEDYFSDDPPPAISHSSVWDKPDYFAEHSSAYISEIGSSDDLESLTPDQHKKHLFGNWLFLWRVLKERCTRKEPETSEEIIKDYDQIANVWSVDAFALMVCTEAHYHHLTFHPKLDDQDAVMDTDSMDLWNDLSELLQDYAVGFLQLEDVTLEHVLDTVTYLISNRDVEQYGEHQIYNSSTLLVVLDIFKSRQQNYDGVLQKLVMLLQMFQLGGLDRRNAAEIYFKNGGYERFDRKKTYNDLASILSKLVLKSRSQAVDGPAYSPPTEKKVVESTATRLLDSLLNLDSPPLTYNNVFTSLPDPYATAVIVYAKDLLPLYEWRTGDTFMWMVDLLCDWCRTVTLSHENKETILDMLGSFLSWEWSDQVLPLSILCNSILETWKVLLLSPDTEIANGTSKAACHALKSMFHNNTEKQQGRELLGEYLEHGLMDSICDFLDQPYATSENKVQWNRLRRMWKEDMRRSPETVTERERQAEQLLKAALPQSGTPLLSSSSAERAPTPTRQGVVLRPGANRLSLSLSNASFSPPLTSSPLATPSYSRNVTFQGP